MRIDTRRFVRPGAWLALAGFVAVSTTAVAAQPPVDHANPPVVTHGKAQPAGGVVDSILHRWPDPPLTSLVAG